MRHRSVISLLAAGTVAALGIAASPAGAVTATPVTGTATSTLSLLKIAVGGKLITAVDAVGSTSTVGTKLANLVIAPLSVDGTKYGATTVTPSQGSRTLAAPSAPALPGGVAQIAAPVLQVAASLPATGPTTVMGATSLGSAKILGLPLSLSGSLAQHATTGANAVGQTGLTLTNLALPSVASLLGALGLDINALPVSTLDALVNRLQLPAPGLTAANSAVTGAQAAASSTVDRLRNAQALLATNQADLVSANSTLASATSALDAQLATLTGPTLALAGLSSIPTAAQYAALSPTVQSVLSAAVPSLSSLDAAFVAAGSAVSAATSAVTAATSLVTALTNLGNLVKSVLSSVPLASIASLDVSAVASAGNNLLGNVTGAVSGVKVAGTDVLKAATGASALDAVALVGSVASQLQGQVDNVATTLHSILSTVPGVSGLDLPMPVIKVLDIAKSTQRLANGNQSALASVTALTVSIAGFTVPSAVALPAAASLPGLGAVAGGVLTPPISVSAGTIAEGATFIPAGSSTAVPGVVTTPKGLASTGGKTGTALVALTLLGLGMGLRRVVRVPSRN